MEIKVKGATITIITQTNGTQRRNQIKKTKSFMKIAATLAFKRMRQRITLLLLFMEKGLIKNSDRNKTAIFGQALAMKNDFV